jgi:hypothetical protein
MKQDYEEQGDVHLLHMKHQAEQMELAISTQVAQKFKHKKF